MRLSASRTKIQLLLLKTLIPSIRSYFFTLSPTIQSLIPTLPRRHITVLPFVCLLQPSCLTLFRSYRTNGTSSMSERALLSDIIFLWFAFRNAQLIRITEEKCFSPEVFSSADVHVRLATVCVRIATTCHVFTAEERSNN